MIRICTVLSGAGYHVTLIGRKRSTSIPLRERPFQQKRLNCFFEKGFLFYAFYNFQLFWYLLFKKADVIGAIDLDTILPCYLVSKIRRKKRIYDAHELFCEMKEIQTRPKIYRVWKWIESKTVPHFKYGYTVNQPIAKELEKMYGVQYKVVRNMPFRKEIPTITKGNFILYQGAVNEGRSFETLIPAMQWVNTKLKIAGDGNFMQQARQLVQKYQLQDKVEFLGLIQPEELSQLTPQARLGFTLFEPEALSNYYSLANRFFDYVQAGTPQICVNYPVYKELVQQFPVAELIDDLSPRALAESINHLLSNPEKLHKMQEACVQAAAIWNWEKESETLLRFYQQLLG